VIKVGRSLDNAPFITPEYFRRQRELHLAEKRGFSKSNIKAYMNLQQIQETPIKRKEWQNLLVIANKFKQDMLPTKKTNENIIILNRKLEEAVKITKLLTATNSMFKAKKGATLFRSPDVKLVTEILTPCQNHPQFVTKIARLSNLFDVPLRPLRKLVNEPENKRSIKLVEQWLSEQRDDEPIMIKIWESIITLRNAEPIHPNISSEKEGLISDALSFFNSTYPISDYSTLWDKILGKFVNSLESWETILQSLKTPTRIKLKL